ncbi:MAG: MFS transporter [Caulobacteraceae bacterium]
MADAAHPASGAPSAPVESDFSFRKIKVAMVCLIGGLFATSLLPFGALAFVLLPMTKEFGWTRTEFSGATTALMWFGSLSVPFLGRLSDKVGVRPVVLIGTVIVGLVTLAVSLQTTSIWYFYTCFALLGVFGSSGVAYQKVIASLFTQHRGKALAIFGAESAVVMAFVPILTNFLVSHFGWRHMFAIYGFIILALVPLIFFTLEEPGLAKGASAWRRPKAGAAKGSPMLAAEGLSIGQAVRDKAFWILAVAAILGMAPGAGMMSHMVAAVVDKGFSQTLAANITSLSMMLGIVWTLLGGFLVDKVQTAKVNIPFLLASAVGVLLFAIVSPMTGGVLLLVVAYSLQGMGLTAGRPMTTYFQTRYFGLRSFAEIAATASAMLSISMGFTPLIMGEIYDHTHSYNWGFAIMGGGMLLSALMFLTLGRYRYSANAMPLPPPETADEAVNPLENAAVAAAE